MTQQSEALKATPWWVIADMPPPATKPEPPALETVYETIIHWDEGGGKRSRRELARRIVALYTRPQAREPEQPAQQEPFGYYKPGEGDYEKVFNWQYNERTGYTEPLYTRPAAREPLTDGEIEVLYNAAPAKRDGWKAFARAIEAAHGIKGDA